MFTATKHPAMRNTIGAGMQVQGPCVFEDGLQIDGLVVGDVMPSSPQVVTKIVIGPTGVVQGHIRANFIIIAGTVQGDVQALESLDLHASARVESQTIHYRTLEMETGAIISGQLRPQLIPPKEAA